MPGYAPPRVSSVPPFEFSSLGKEAVDLISRTGLVLDPWQEMVLNAMLAQREDGRWAAFEVALLVPRQNGKGSIEEARELVGLFLLGEGLIIHSAHQFDTSIEHFRRLLNLIEDTPELERKIKKITRSHGEEGIELIGGSRIRFRTRTKGGGRGFSCDFLCLDEAMFLHDVAMGALLPTLSARPNPQVLYAGSAVDQLVHENGLVLARLRERGHGGADPSLAYFEWSLDLESPSEVTDEIAVNQEAWAQVNPALGVRIRPEHIEFEQRSMDPRTFAVERLNVGDWPNPDQAIPSAIPLEQWDDLADSNSTLLDPVCFAYDISPERRASIAAAGRNQEGYWHIEVLAQRDGTGWLGPRLLELVERHQPYSVVCDGYGPSGSLVHPLTEMGVNVQAMTSVEHGQACGLLLDAVNEKTLRHLGSDELRRAIRGAATRPLGDAWAWSRKGSHIDISPLVASTLALWAAIQSPDVSGEIAIY